MNRTTRAPETAGALFVVATPIGNLADITLRALDALRDADLILAEDTRRARVLLRHHGIGAKLQSFHSHNESAQLEKVLAKLAARRAHRADQRRRHAASQRPRRRPGARRARTRTAGDSAARRERGDRRAVGRRPAGRAVLF